VAPDSNQGVAAAGGHPFGGSSTDKEHEMSEFTMTIGGEAIEGAETFPVLDPATEEVCGAAPRCSPDQLDRAMAAAEAALPAWSRDREARRDAMLAAADALERAADEIVPVLTAEQGKTLADSAFELSTLPRWLRHFAELELPTEVLQDDETALSVLHHRSIGVVAAITPWNFPVYQIVEKLAPALATGNTVVLKPSPYTPLSTLMVGERIREILPPGVVNIVSGGDELGAAMVAHPVPRMVSFTGSIETGKKVAAAAAPDLKVLKLELGGNDPAIVLDDADPEAIAPKIFWVAFGNCGAICNGIKRVYAPDALFGDVVDALAEQARAAKIGPINNRPQYERVIELTADAIAAGATAVTGGGPVGGPGYFFEPTILTGVGDGVRVVDEEQFGPVLPVMAYSSLDDAIASANRTHFGLAASVWSRDEQRAAEVGERLDTGTVGINSHLIGGERIPYGGVKHSGIGAANGLEGMREYTFPRVVSTARGWGGIELPDALEATGQQ
jgi:acyl-CoA reductase-like NAD-dependent aldehyde dehydrogenase